MTRVSVIVPTRNREKLLVGALESVFAQTYTDYEVLVIDDGSTDGTETVCRELDDRIRYVRLDREKEPGGAAAARNRGASEATGQWLAFLDSDDLWPTDYLERMASAMGARRDAVAASCVWPVNMREKARKCCASLAVLSCRKQCETASMTRW